MWGAFQKIKDAVGGNLHNIAGGNPDESDDPKDTELVGGSSGKKRRGEASEEGGSEKKQRVAAVKRGEEDEASTESTLAPHEGNQQESCPKSPTTIDFGDARELLKFDPEWIIYPHIEDLDMLNKLDDFAKKLTNYVEWAKRHYDINTADDTPRPLVKVEEGEEPAEVVPISVSSSEATTPIHTEDEWSKEGKPSAAYAAIENGARNTRVSPSESATPTNAQEGCNEKDAATDNDTHSAIDPVDTRQSGSAFRTLTEELNYEEESHSGGEEAQPHGQFTENSSKKITISEPSPKRHDQRTSSVQHHPDHNQLQHSVGQATHSVATGYCDYLEHSRLQCSVGLTKKSINSNIESLGLLTGLGGFGMNKTRWIAKGKVLVSSLTMQRHLNELPIDPRQKLQFRIPGTATYRGGHPLQMPGHPPIPVFWAQECQENNGHFLYYYVGHFQCDNFDTKEKRVVKGIQRQALVEFEFVEFKEEVAQKMAQIATANGGGYIRPR